jgi:hypothetical protein
MTRKEQLILGAVIAFVAAAAIAMTGCASALDKARQAVSTVATLERTTGEMVIAIDADTQDSIAAELDRTGNVSLAKIDRDAWRAKRKQIRQALLTCHAAVVAGSVATELAASGGGNINLSAIIADIIKAGKALSDALASFGISLPGVGGLL